MNALQFISPILDRVVIGSPIYLPVIVGLAGYIVKQKHDNIRDGLTGLRNRRGLDQAITKLIKITKIMPMPEQVAVISIDLKGFKPINDTYGHDVGDLALQYFSKATMSSVKTRKDCVARPGGDEFIIILRDKNAESSASSVIERLRTYMKEKPFQANDKQIPFDFNYGINVIAPIDIKKGKINKHNFLRSADKNMYNHKRPGSGNHIML